MSAERLAAPVREQVRAEIAAAHGREVSFVVRPDANGLVVEARVVARGTVDAVLALPGIAGRGEMLVHNHPSGVLEPSGADLADAAGNVDVEHLRASDAVEDVDGEALPPPVVELLGKGFAGGDGDAKAGMRTDL